MNAAIFSSTSTTWVLKACCNFKSSFVSSWTPKSAFKQVITTCWYFSPILSPKRLCACLSSCALITFGSRAVRKPCFSSVIALCHRPISRSTTPSYESVRSKDKDSWTYQEHICHVFYWKVFQAGLVAQDAYRHLVRCICLWIPRKNRSLADWIRSRELMDLNSWS